MIRTLMVGTLTRVLYHFAALKLNESMIPHLAAF